MLLIVREYYYTILKKKIKDTQNLSRHENHDVAAIST